MINNDNFNQTASTACKLVNDHKQTYGYRRLSNELGIPKGHKGKAG
jgi:hypothetical protein